MIIGEIYLLFIGDIWYPAGGWTDIDSQHLSLSSAKAKLSMYMKRGRVGDWWQIVEISIDGEGIKSTVFRQGRFNPKNYDESLKQWLAE